MENIYINPILIYESNIFLCCKILPVRMWVCDFFTVSKIFKAKFCFNFKIYFIFN